MHVHVQLWLDFMSEGSKFRSGTHTYPLFLYNVCDSPNCRTQDISTCHPSLASANGSSTQGSLLFLLHRSFLLKQDAHSPLVHICHHKCLLHVYVEMTQGVTVKKGIWRCSFVHQLSKPTVSLCHITCVQ